MNKIFKNLKPYMSVILIAISLLFVQAFADLRLPKYMSNIVNVGIQQSGIDHASPKEMSQNAHYYLKLNQKNFRKDTNFRMIHTF